MADDLERFLALVKRELGCDDAQVVDRPGEGEDARVLLAALPDGRVLAARFAEPPVDAEARRRRLVTLVSTFDDLFADTIESRRSRPPVASSLHDELSALCARAVALNALVVDANSPIVWGAAHPEGLTPRSPDDSAVMGIGGQEKDRPDEESQVLGASRRVLRAVRGWEDLAALRRGRRLRRVDREGDAPLLAHSFAGIYVLVLAFAAAFDELRAERAILDALPRVERLVLALPPLDPEPSQGGGAVALRRPRRG